MSRAEQEVFYQVDIRYKGQGMKLTVDVTPATFASEGLAGITRRFDAEHEQLFTFALDAEHELVSLRAVVQGAEKSFVNAVQRGRRARPLAARMQETRIYADGDWRDGHIYDRSKLIPGNKISGPAIVLEMDSTSVILPGHVGVIDHVGNILIWPADHQNAR